MNSGARQHSSGEKVISTRSGTRAEASANSTLRAKARALVDAGRLPITLPNHRWGGPGTGSMCSVCGDPVGRDQMDIEVELAGPGSDATDHHFHVPCLSALEHELRNRPRSGLSLPSNGGQLPGALGTDDQQGL
jgi:hypothetical protein